jgi:inhibitor of KinA
MNVVPLSDQAALVYLRNEGQASLFAASIRQGSFPWLVDLVQAYTSVAIFFDLNKTHLSVVQEQLTSLSMAGSPSLAAGGCHHIPCCYEMQLDLKRVAQHTGLSEEKVIALHVQTEYTVYAVGFTPGFPYLGYLRGTLSGVPRLPAPRTRVEGGSVGVAGRQTGIYPEARPGGWNVIGRTPLQLVNVEDGYFPIRTSDHVRFERIDERQFQKLLGERL